MGKNRFGHISTEEKAEDIYKGMLNPAYIIQKYLRTIDLTKGGYVDFKLFPRQAELVKAYKIHRNNIVTKPRQTGITTTTAAFLAVICALASDKKPEEIVIIANKFKAAKQFISKIREFMSQLPPHIWLYGFDYKRYKEGKEGHLVGQGSVERLDMCNGSTIKALGTSPDALRGLTPTYLVIDEAAYIDTFAQELYRASMAALATGGRMIIVSTPNGKDELYYRVYKNARDGLNGFNVVYLKWYEDPRYNTDLVWEKTDEDGNVERVKEELFTFANFEKMDKAGYKPTSSWYRDMCAKLNNDRIAIARELDVKFEGSAGTVVKDEWIRHHEKYNVSYEYKKDKKNEHLWIWDLPKEGVKYMIGVDVSSGTGDDFSGLVILDVDNLQQVAELKMKIRPEELAVIVNDLSNLYKALIVIDCTGGYGDVLVLKLEEMGNEYIYYSTRSKKLTNKYKVLDQNKKHLVAGVKISQFRPQMVSKMVSYVESTNFTIKSIRLISELETFIWVNGRPDHQSGYHDDLIFALIVVLWVLETEFKNLEKAKKQSEAAMEALLKVNNTRQIQEKEHINLNNRNKNKNPLLITKNTPRHRHSYRRGSYEDRMRKNRWLFD